LVGEAVEFVDQGVDLAVRVLDLVLHDIPSVNDLTQSIVRALETKLFSLPFNCFDRSS
jgi:hypothetical protein